MTAVFHSAARPRIRRPDEMAWHDRAACRQSKLDFFPEAGDYRIAHAAVAICRGCPVREECLRTALDAPVREWGIWGGFTERNRTIIARQHKAGVPLADLIDADDERHYRRISARPQEAAA